VIDEVRGLVRAARRIVVLTGAGMSAESGVPTFRDAQTGLWAKFRPEELATEEAFRRDPARVWAWYAMRREGLAQVEPNAGHLALAAFQARHPGRLTVVTQNVDGLHQRAGSPGVLALHGSIAEDKWLDAPRACCNPDAVVAGSPPYCDRCGNLRRPAVVWFGEALPLAAFEAAQQAARECELMLVVGTSGAVYPAAGLARATRGKVVVVNPHPSELDDAADFLLRGSAAATLPALLED
jgi:NAD-dependent deacetylase